MEGLNAALASAGLSTWDLVFLALLAAGWGLTAAFGLGRANRALFGFSCGLSAYVAVSWALDSLPSLPVSEALRASLSANRDWFRGAAWILMYACPLAAAFVPTLSLDPSESRAVAIALRIVAVPALLAWALSSAFALSAAGKFPFPAPNPAVSWGLAAPFLAQPSALWGFLLGYGPLALALAAAAGGYLVFFAPVASKVAEKVDSIRLPSFFKDAAGKPAQAPAEAAPERGPEGEWDPHGHHGR